MSRQTASGLLGCRAECRACAWSSTARNAIGNAARHHDASGHAVTVEVTRQITYGDLNAAPTGQTSILEELENL